VLAAMRVDPEIGASTIRVSLGWELDRGRDRPFFCGLGPPFTGGAAVSPKGARRGHDVDSCRSTPAAFL